jgi:SAM-dependent methyltransferase
MGDMANRDQAAHWNDRAGRTWAELQPLLDRTFAGFVPLLTEPLEAGRTRSVLDVGCGAGALTLAAAERLGPSARCLGVDISAPLVAAAEARARDARATGVAFRTADAQTADFEPSSFDAVLSRFGVMFFDNPSAAFANLRRATRPGGLLRFAAWRAPRENPFMTVAKRTVGHLVEFPAYEPDAPGQFGFANGERVRGLLAASGWSDVAIEAVDVPCSFLSRDLTTFATRMGPLGGMWPSLAPSLQTQIEALLRDAFRRFEEGNEIVFTAASWLVSARP